MKRVDKLFRNSVTSVVIQIISICLAFISRKLFLHYLGIEYVGVNGLFTNVLSLMSLSELGFASAISYNLYKPLANKDTVYIAALMRFYRNVYRAVAGVITVTGIIFLFFISSFVGESAFSLDYLRIVYILFLAKTVMSYFFSYRMTLVTADQRKYRLFKLELIEKLLVTSVNLLILCITHNYILYLSSMILLEMVFVIIKAYIIGKEYPYITGKGEGITKEERKKILTDVKNLFIAQVSTKILNSTDNIIISKCINIATVGLYDNYHIISSYLLKIIDAAMSSLPNALGSVTATETKEHSKEVLRKTTTVMFIMGSFPAVSLFCLADRFIALFFGGQYVIDIFTVFIISFNLLFQIVKSPIWYILKGTGLFARDKYISLTGAVSNLVISIILVFWLGLPGVILGTVISQLLQMVLKNRLLFHDFYMESGIKYGVQLLSGFGIFGIELVITWYACKGTASAFSGETWISFICCAVCCLIIPNAISWLFYRRSEGYKYAISFIRNKLKKKKQ